MAADLLQAHGRKVCLVGFLLLRLDLKTPLPQ